jgi:hypothetical protein
MNARMMMEYKQFLMEEKAAEEIRQAALRKPLDEAAKAHQATLRQIKSEAEQLAARGDEDAIEELNDLYALQAREAAKQWIATQPDYFPCNSNFEAMVKYLLWKLGDGVPGVADFEEAYQTLTKSHDLIPSPKPKVPDAPAYDERPKSFVGYRYDTVTKDKYGVSVTQEQLDNMTSEEYADRFLQRLPNNFERMRRDGSKR